MKRIDRYIIKKLLSTIVFVLGLFVIISVVIDFSERVDDFLDSGASVGDVLLRNYAPFCLFFS